MSESAEVDENQKMDLFQTKFCPICCRFMKIDVLITILKFLSLILEHGVCIYVVSNVD